MVWHDPVTEDDRFAGFTLRARKVFQLANQEAHRLNHGYIGTEHLVLGLVKEDIGVASRLLRRNNFELARARSEVEKVAPAGGGSRIIPGQVPDHADVEVIIERARKEAADLKHEQVGTGHVLLALVGLTTAKGAQILARTFPITEMLRDVVVTVLNETNWPDIEGHQNYEGSRPSPILRKQGG